MKKLSYSNLMSHPEKFLEEHLENVANFSKFSFSSLNFENHELYSEIAFLIGLSHDFAKSTSYFQNYLLKDEKTEFTPHSFLSSIFTYFVVNNYLKEKNINFDLNLAIISFIVVLHHHGNLRDVHTLDDYFDKKVDSKLVRNQINDLINQEESLYLFYNNYGIEIKNFLNSFEEICDDISENLFDFEYETNFDNYFCILLFYSVLLDADKMDASQSEFIKRNEIPNIIVDEYKENHSFNLDGINKIREEAYIEVNNNIGNLDLNDKIYSINLPTGIGKTLTGLSSVLKLKNRIKNELNINPRIIYSLPFLSVIDQNEQVIRDIFTENNLNGTNYLLKHNYLAEMKYVNNDENEEYDISNSKILIEGWNSEFIITTFIQFFYSLIGNKNSYLRKFHNITNSIILLDEIQSIPYKYWGIINSLLKKLANEYNCWIILMTATQPFIFKSNEILSLVEDVEHYFNQFDSIDYDFKLDDISLTDFSIELLDVILKNNDKDIMVVLNTVRSSMELYNSVKEYLNDSNEIHLDENGVCLVGEKINLIYLSTNILPFHRLNKINRIKDSNKQNIVITTQLIEAGVDIDMDIVYRDFAPLDSIIQTAGRCNRSGKKNKGIVNVISLVNSNGKMYSQYVYQKLLLNTTREVLRSYSKISEKDFNLKASNKYFDLISQRSFDDEELKSIMNFLKFEMIPSKFKLIENSSKRIDVFVCVNNEAEEIFNQYKYIAKNLKGFERKSEFLKIKNKFYQYVISVDENKIGSTNIFNDEIYVISPEDLNLKYSLDTGFIISDDEDPMIW